MKPGSIYTVPKYRELVIVGVARQIDEEYIRGTEIILSSSKGELLSLNADTYRKRSEAVELVEQPRNLEPAVSIQDMNQVVSLDELRALWPNPKTAAEESEEEGLEA